MKKYTTGLACAVAALVVAFAARQADAGQDPDELHRERTMERGDYLESSMGNYRFYLQRDGNLVVRSWPENQVVWASNTAGEGGSFLRLQEDSNLVLYTSTRRRVWASNTRGLDANKLVLGDDGTLALYRGADVVWLLGNDPDPRGYECLGSRLHRGEWISQCQRICSGPCSLGIDVAGVLVGWYEHDEYWLIDGPGDYLYMKANGNLVFYDEEWHKLWATGTSSGGPSSLSLSYNESSDMCEAAVIDRHGVNVWFQEF